MNRKIFLFLFLLPFYCEANIVGLVHFDIAKAKDVHCEPLQSLNIKPTVTVSHDTVWLDFGNFSHDLYPFIVDMAAMKQHYMVAGPDTTILDLFGPLGMATFSGQRSGENSLLYTMYAQTGIIPFDADVTMDKLVKIENKQAVVHVNIPQQREALNQYQKEITNIPAGKSYPDFVKQLAVMGDLSFKARMLNTYLLLTDHHYELPKGDSEVKALYELADSIASQPDYTGRFMPCTILYTQLLYEYQAVKRNYAQGKVNQPLQYMVDIVYPALDEINHYDEPAKSIILLYYLKKVYEAKSLRNEYYAKLYHEAIIRYPATFQNESLMAVYHKAIGNEQQKTIGKAVDGTLKLIDGKMHTVTLHDLTANGKGLFIIAWASWCSRCRESIDIFNQLQKTYAAKTNFISLSIDRTREDWQKGLDHKHLSGTPYLDTNFNRSFANKLRLDYVPQIIVLDKDLKIVSFNEAGNIAFYQDKLQNQ